MRKLNKKGFTMVEILAVIMIMGILSSLAIGAVSRYLDSAKAKSYLSMAESAANATENYIMESKKQYLTPATLGDTSWKNIRKDNSSTKMPTSIYISGTRVNPVTDTAYYLTFEDLVKGGFLSETYDPTDRGKMCTGRVYIYYEKATEKRQLDKYSYLVYECCSQNKGRYTYYSETDASGVTTNYKTRTKNSNVVNQICNLT